MKILYAVMAMIAIVLVQMVLAAVFNWHIAEVFSGTAVGALFFCSLFRMSARRHAEK